MEAFSTENNPFWRTRKCTNFHNDKHCSFGSACLYKHELQGCKKKRRHFYITKLTAASLIYSEAHTDDAKVEASLSGGSRLPIFQSIHRQEGDDSNDDDDFKYDLKPQNSSDEYGSTDTGIDSN